MALPRLLSWLSPFSQTIGTFDNHPETSWQRFFNPQLIFNYNPEDAPVESYVLSQVGSYGSQLSTMMRMIDVLSTQVIRDPATLTPVQQASVKDFNALAEKSREAVGTYRKRQGKVNLSEVKAFLEQLKTSDPSSFDKLMETLNGAAGKHSSAPTSVPRKSRSSSRSSRTTKAAVI